MMFLRPSRREVGDEKRNDHDTKDFNYHDLICTFIADCIDILLFQPLNPLMSDVRAKLIRHARLCRLEERQICKTAFLASLMDVCRI